jgi:hypothetical protein
LVDLDIVRSYPADPRKTGESGEEIGGKEVYDNNQLGSKSQDFQDEKADCRRCTRRTHM